MTAARVLGRDQRRLAVVLVVLGSIAASAWHSDAHFTRLFDIAGLHNFGEIFSGLLSPDTDSDFLSRIAKLALESLLIGALGIGLALIFAIPLAIGAARIPQLDDDPLRRPWIDAGNALVRQLCRGTLAMLRSVPEIVWAFLFVRIFGLGPGPAVFAIALTFAGIIGKLFAELLEAADPVPARRLRASGASTLAVFLYGQLPQVRRQWIAYALFRLECGIRSASILGIVGAGGLGSEIQLSIRYFQYDKLATALIAVLAYVVLLELASFLLRRSRPVWPIGFMLAATVAGVVMLDIPWSALTTSDAATQAQAFIAGFGNPTHTSSFVWTALELSLLTVAMAWCATMLAAIIAFVLAPLSATTFTLGGYLRDSPRGRGPLRWLAIGLVAPARVLLQLARALPELLWAMVFIVWVEPGSTAGILALTVHTVGILGRLYGDALEEAEPDPPRSLEAAGVGPLGRYLYGVMPQVLPRMLAFTLFRFEVNIRSAAMVGFVGAGGLGDALHTAISLFHWDDLAGLLVVLIAVVLIVDTLGDRIRLSILSAGGR